MVLKLGQRRDFFVKKWFQARIICYYLLILAAGGSALAYVIYRRAVATLRYCLFRGHVQECSSWELLRAEVIKTNVTATIVVIALAIIAVVVISWMVARAARAVETNIRASMAGANPATWPRPPRPHEFRDLQDKLGAGLAAHRGRIEEVQLGIAELRERIREARADLEGESGGLTPAKNRELHTGFETVKNLFRTFKIT